MKEFNSSILLLTMDGVMRHYLSLYSYIIINTHGRFAIAFLPLTTRLSTELFEAVFIKKSSG